MQKLTIFLLFFGLGLSSCYVEQGPPGPAGFDGLDGKNGDEGFVFEYQLSFTAPDYSQLLLLPDDFTMLDSDVMLIYFLWEVADDGTEIWRALPQTLYFQDGILAYNYDFTKYDANVFLDGTVNLDGLGADWTDNWIARIVVVPALYANGRSSIDFSNYDEVKTYFNLSPSKLATKQYTKRPN